MSQSALALLWLRDPRLAPLALGSPPAWLWSLDAKQVLWANPPGAALLGAPDSASLALRRFDAWHPAARQVARAVAMLPADGTPQLHRLRGFAEFGRALTCRCARLALADGTGAMLVDARESAGPDLPLAEQLRRLLAGCAEPLAAFSVDGALIHATPAAAVRLDGADTLAAAADALAGQAARDDGDAGASLDLVPVGSEGAISLIASFAPLPSASNQQSATPAGDDNDAVNMAAAAPPAEQTASTDSPADDAAQALPPVGATSEWRRPLRFVWQMDAEGRFTLTSDDFLALLGPQTAAALGRPWDTIAAELGLDPQGLFARAVATRDTWSSLTVAWPVDGSPERLGTELSGLPVFDRERVFRGYRGFGVCRDVGRLAAVAALADLRRTGTDDHAAGPDADPDTTLESRPEAEPQTESDDASESVAPAGNVVPFPIAAEVNRPSLNPTEHRAFHELARRLTTGLAANAPASALAARTLSDLTEPTEPDENVPADITEEPPVPADARAEAPTASSSFQAGILDPLPLGVLIYRLSQLLYANRAFLDWIGFADIEALQLAGGLDAVLIEPVAMGAQAPGTAFPVMSPRTGARPAQARLLEVPWDGDDAFALVTELATDPPAAEPTGETPDGAAALAAARAEIAELTSILETTTDGVLVLHGSGHILSANRGAQALFGYDGDELAGRPLAELLADESEPVALAYLDGLLRDGVASLINDGREVVGRVRQGGLVPLFMTLARTGDGSDRFCAVLRDITARKKAEEDLGEAHRLADEASVLNANALAKLSHEIRTPLNTIIGFSEVMMQERLGPVGNQRYQQYAKDIHVSAGHLLSLVNEFIDLSRIESGQIELTFANVALNDITQQCVAVVQPQANRERIIIRTSLSPGLPQVIADERSVRQIVLSLLSNSIRLTGPAGQVIVSTALAERGEVVLRVRDTGLRLSQVELGAVSELFRRSMEAGGDADRVGLGLPMAKALAEANRATFAVKNSPGGAGTLVEVSFPAARVLAE